MSNIKFLKARNFLGITEREIEFGKVNIFRGPNGRGKTSIIEAIEKTLTNKNRRTEIIKHGEEEATLYAELNDGLSIDRRIRNGKGDYFKLRKGDEGVSSTEKFLRSYVNGEIFRPMDWINKSVKEQTQSLLNMVEIGWSDDDIVNWFGELTDNIDYSQHILVILKQIETKYYKDREENNRQKNELEARIKAIVTDLPVGYDGERWKNVNVQEYYKKVSDAQRINQYIAEAKSLQDNFQTKVDAINADAERKKARIELAYESERNDIDDLISLSNIKIQKANDFISNSDHELELCIKELANKKTEMINKFNSDYTESLEKLKSEFEAKKNRIKEQLEINIKHENIRFESAKKDITENTKEEVEEQKKLINIHSTKIATQQQKLLGLDDKEKAEKEYVDNSAMASIEKEKVRIGNASKYLEENSEVDIEPLQNEADEVQEMVSYLRDWNRIAEIRDNQLAPRQQYSDLLTSRINKARSLPQELLQTAKMPIDDFSVDENGRVRINDILIDGLSEGEKLTLAIKVAKAQCGDLKIVCIDNFETLDEESQKKLLSQAESDEDGFQYFITQVGDSGDSKIHIEKFGEVC